jgi:ubiquinone/menaquinone biosynthesis C-methylase UbiE/uncharacterized protein YbaR (Trm112 family)
VKETILNIVQCPVLKSGLTLHVFSSEKLTDGNGRPYTDIDNGLLINAKGTAYPIIDGVPRLIEGAFTFNKVFRDKWESRIKMLDAKIDEPSQEFKKFILPTLKRFEKEWKEHELTTTTWGLQQQERVEYLLTSMAITKEYLAGKLILDAGAGTGQLTCSYATLGCEVVGVDLSPSIVRGWKERKKWAGKNFSNVTIIQANIMQLPFKEKTFDAISSLGVLHHTPNTRAAFNALTPFVKPGGVLGVWLYLKTKESYSLPLLPFVAAKRLALNYDKLRKITTKMPPKLLYSLLTVYTSYFHLAYKINEFIRGKKHRQTIKERVTLLFDSYAPPYVWRHEPAEVIEWFKASGFHDIKDTTLPIDYTIGFHIRGIR